MSADGNLYRIAAFSESAEGGNPAGVWVGEALPDAGEMQRIAAEVGYSETAFIAPVHGIDRTVRYYSPEAEVPFCGHATFAAGYVIGNDGQAITYRFSTAAGEVAVAVRSSDGGTTVSLTSVEPRQRAVPDALMLREGLTTLQRIWRENDMTIHARDPFSVGGVVEDPATGAAAAALGGYLRDAGLIATPGQFTIRQGEAMGRPSLLSVDVPASGGITVSGSAIEM
jgi:predicted PhzF superfamily epimerase YddE/YHI9